jgi:uncharacterized protein DUF1707
VTSESKPTIRASDAEREQVARSFRDHLAAGRLTLDEFSTRVGLAYQAVTVGELQRLTADLPDDDAGPPERSARRPLWPGNLPFLTRIWTRASATEVKAEAMRTVVPRLIAEGYQLETNDATLLVARRKHRPGWTVAVAVLAFPLGAAALLHEDRSQVAISIDEGDEETVVTVSGTAPLDVRRVVRSLALENE